jgi:hypothetical protein
MLLAGPSNPSAQNEALHSVQMVALAAVALMRSHSKFNLASLDIS